MNMMNMMNIALGDVDEAIFYPDQSAIQQGATDTTSSAAMRADVLHAFFPIFQANAGLIRVVAGLFEVPPSIGKELLQEGHGLALLTAQFVLDRPCGGDEIIGNQHGGIERLAVFVGPGQVIPG